jgi:thymidylate synthase (FAD)
MKVKLLEHMGDDLSVVNAARVSLGRWHDEFNGADARLIRYLAEHKHWEPFAHPQISFRIKAPIFIARQLQKHRVGFAWNEISRRYVDDTPEFYEPDYWRRRAEDVKQGSSNEKVNLDPILERETETGCTLLPKELYQHALDTYSGLIELGVCPEQARMVLPQAMYTEWVWTGSLLGWSRVYNLRADKHAQLETQQIAQMIGSHMLNLYPFSWRALTI